MISLKFNLVYPPSALLNHSGRVWNPGGLDPSIRGRGGGILTKAKRRREKIISKTTEILWDRECITLDHLVYELDKALSHSINRTCVAMILATVDGIEKDTLLDSGRKFTVYTLK